MYMYVSQSLLIQQVSIAVSSIRTLATDWSQIPTNSEPLIILFSLCNKCTMYSSLVGDYKLVQVTMNNKVVMTSLSL